jgi:hypothetical protein
VKGSSHKVNVQDIDRFEERGRSFASIKRARDKLRRLKENEQKEKAGT